MRDALMAVYGSYYIGSNQHNPNDGLLSNRNTDLDGRATNTYGMNNAMRKAFSNPDSPWVVMDDSRRWMERHGNDTLAEQQRVMGNGYFVTLYHKDSGQIMIASPGLEGDDDPGTRTDRAILTTHWLQRSVADIGDIAFNAREGVDGTTHLRQTRAEREYIHELSGQIRRGEIQVNVNGRAVQLQMGEHEDPRGRFVLAGHSAGTIAAQTLSGLGYRSFLIEPRMYDNNFEGRMINNLEYITGHRSSGEDFRANTERSAINLRSSFSNIWNDGNTLPRNEFAHQSPGRDYVYHIPGQEAGDNFLIASQHRVEVSVPGLLGITGSTEYIGSAHLVSGALPGSAAREMAEGAPSASRQNSPSLGNISLTPQPMF